MDLALTDEQQQLWESVNGLLAKESSPERVRAAEDTGFDADLWERLLEVGVTAMAVGEEHGGWGATLLDLSLIAELAGTHLASAPIIESQVAARLLAATGSPAAAEVLARALDGTAIVTLALHPSLDGTLPLVPAGYVADHVVALRGNTLLLQTPEQTPKLAEERGIVTRSSANLGSSGRRRVANLGGLPLADLSLTDDAVEISSGAAAVALYESAVDEWLTLTAAAVVGIAARAQEMAVAYAIERRAWGVPIGTFQGVSHPLADSATSLDGARLLARKAAWSSDVGDPRRAELAAMAFAFASETARDATYRALHIHGGYGFMLEQDVQLHYRRARGWPRIWGDATAAHRRVAAARYGQDG